MRPRKGWARKYGRVKSSKTLFSSAAVPGHGDRTHLVLIQNTTHNSGWKGSANTQCHIEAIHQGDSIYNNEPSKAQLSLCFVCGITRWYGLYLHASGQCCPGHFTVSATLHHIFLGSASLLSWGVARDSTICLPQPWRCWDSWPCPASHLSLSGSTTYLRQTTLKDWSLKMTISL